MEIRPEPQQERAIDQIVGNTGSLMVLGGPGTGKTLTALRAATSFLQSDATAVASRVLFLTFSRTAVSQLVARAPAVLGGYASAVEMRTFHGLAYWLLEGFGRYDGRGMQTSQIQSEANRRLLGSSGGLQYADLIPAAIELLGRSSRLRGLLQVRWPLVICDESQDIGADERRMLEVLSPERLMFLGDANQMIYRFKDGVSDSDFDALCDTADVSISLPARSYRDPSGAIPALAEAVRTRVFGSPAVSSAIASQRLQIVTGVDEIALAEVLPNLITEVQTADAKEVGVFVHTNAAVALLADILGRAEVPHVIVGIPEAHSEALGAMMTQIAFGLGEASEEDVRVGLALFLTAVTRGQRAPALAVWLRDGEGLPEQVANRVEALFRALHEAAAEGIVDLIAVATQSWPGLTIGAGYEAWRRGAAHFCRLARAITARPTGEITIPQLTGAVDAARTEALIEQDWSLGGRVSLMNFHQTKGREADVVLHVFLENDYFGDETEPFPESSRLMNVAITRARARVVLILPPDPHPLVAPFAALGGTTS